MGITVMSMLDWQAGLDGVQQSHIVLGMLVYYRVRHHCSGLRWYMWHRSTDVARSRKSHLGHEEQISRYLCFVVHSMISQGSKSVDEPSTSVSEWLNLLNAQVKHFTQPYKPVGTKRESKN
jgi:hypothetical protein